MSKKSSKKSTPKKAAPERERYAKDLLWEAFNAAVHPRMADGFAEPNASKYTRRAFQRFVENLDKVE